MESLLVGSFPKLTSHSFRVLSEPSSSFPGAQVAKLRVHNSSMDELAARLEQKPRFAISEGKSPIDRRRAAVLLASAVSRSPAGSSGISPPENPLRASVDALGLLFKFSRPYVTPATVLNIISISILATERLSEFTPSLFLKIAEVIVAGLLMQLYVNGFNQLSDIEIDKVNKPYLPLASGEFSIRTAVVITAAAATMSFGIALRTGSWPFKVAILLWCLLGTGYSMHLPLLRWKENPVAAALCILAVRASVIPSLLYLHARMYMHGKPAVFPKPGIFAVGMLVVFSLVITFFKDIPDMEGDKLYGMESLATRIGPKPIFWGCVGALGTAYSAAVLVGLSSSHLWSRCVTVIAHALLGLTLWNRAKSADLKSKEAMDGFYMFIWKLLYAEYLLIPLVRGI